MSNLCVSSITPSLRGNPLPSPRDQFCPNSRQSCADGLVASRATVSGPRETGLRAALPGNLCFDSRPCAFFLPRRPSRNGADGVHASCPTTPTYVPIAGQPTPEAGPILTSSIRGQRRTPKVATDQQSGTGKDVVAAMPSCRRGDGPETVEAVRWPRDRPRQQKSPGTGPVWPWPPASIPAGVCHR